MLGHAQRSLRTAIAQRSKGRIELLERQAGGGAVLSGPWLVSASIVLPYGHPLLCESVAGCYRWLGQLHAAALAEFGVSVRALPPQQLPLANAMMDVRTVDWACFGSLSPWEVVGTDCRKLVGLAQRRRHTGVLLVAGTLLGVSDWRLLCEVMGYPEDEALLRQRTVTCEELAGRTIAPADFASVLAKLIGDALTSNE